MEMEALTACAFAGLTLVCSLLEVDPEVSMEELTLWHKSGGRSGDWQRSVGDGPSHGPKGPPAVTADAVGVEPLQQG